MQPEITGFFHQPTNTVSYVVADPETAACAVIDSVLDYDQDAGRTGTAHADRIVAHIRAHGLRLDWILETHVHADHLSAAPYLRDTLGGRIAIGARITTVQHTFAVIYNAERGFARDGSQFDHLFADGETFAIGALAAEYLATPGHTPACGSYKVGDNIFVGDTLFMPDYGTARCDFPGGDARTMYRSIRRILSYHPQTVLWMCHDYGAPGREGFAWRTTVGAEREENLAGPRRHRRGRIRGAPRGARRLARHAEAPHPLDPGQHARRQPAAARGQRHPLPQGPDERDRPQGLTAIPSDG